MANDDARKIFHSLRPPFFFVCGFEFIIGIVFGYRTFVEAAADRTYTVPSNVLCVCGGLVASLKAHPLHLLYSILREFCILSLLLFLLLMLVVLVRYT